MIYSATNKLNVKRTIIYVVLTIFITALIVSNTGAQTTQSKTETNKTKKETKTMQNKDFTTTFTVEKTPQEVFNAVNNVRGWWSEEIEGSTDKLNAEFLYHYKDIHICKMKIVESIPGKKVVWLVLDNHFNFTKDETEWKGTKVSFEIFEEGNKTQLLFTHIGLVPEYECYKVCYDGWSNYINNSLYSLITTGKGQPNPKEGDGFNAELAEKWKLK